MAAFDDLMAFTRDTEALAQVAGRLSWDQETVMPRGAGAQRAEEMGAMESVLHARRTDPRIADWLAAAQAPDAAGAAQLRLIGRSYERAVRVPADLATALARLTSQSQGVWAEARADNDFAAFAPVLTEVVTLKREEGAALADGGDVYDAMLDTFEPDATAAELQAMFDAMRDGLVRLRLQALDGASRSAITGTFDEAAQMRLSRELAERFGYDFTRGRIDKAVHPFSSGSGDDARITTRTSADDPFNCLYSTIHEVGHACYEQGVDRAWHLTPVGHGVSMGVHESQSRIYENQLGRSRAFCHFLYGRMRDTFGEIGVQDEAAQSGPFVAVVERDRLRWHDGRNRVLVDKLRLPVPPQQNAEVVEPGNHALQFHAVHEEDRYRNFTFSNSVQKSVLEVLLVGSHSLSPYGSPVDRAVISSLMYGCIAVRFPPRNRSNLSHRNNFS